MSIDRELIRRGVIVPTFKTKQNNISYTFKGRYYFNYTKARAKARSLNLQGASDWKKYCYLNDTLPHGVPESPEIVYRNNGWVNFNDWLGIKIVKKSLSTKDSKADQILKSLNYKAFK